MPEIIEQGRNDFEATCRRCLCRFRYKLDELTRGYVGGDYIACPSCSERVTHLPISLFTDHLTALLSSTASKKATP